MILAVDSSTQWIGLAIYDGSQVISEWTWRTRNHHTVELSPAIQELMNRAGISGDALQALVVAQGPGSFTSLRIGMAVVKGLALALHLPVVAVPTLDISAAAIPPRDVPLAAVLQAGRNRLAVGWYAVEDGHWVSQGPAQVMTVDDLAAQVKKPTLICGELDDASRKALARKWKNVQLASPAQCVRRPALLAEIGWQRWQEGKVEEVVSLAPIYLHVAEPIPA